MTRGIWIAICPFVVVLYHLYIVFYYKYLFCESDTNNFPSWTLPYIIPIKTQTKNTASQTSKQKTMPFHGQDAWRRHPLFQNLHRDPLPGFRAAVVVFGVYLMGEYIYKSTKYAMTPKVKN